MFTSFGGNFWIMSSLLQANIGRVTKTADSLSRVDEAFLSLHLIPRPHILQDRQ